ncbi:MAG: molybdate/tungstate transport system ATP-binding protein, partial [Candidatus Binatia bacterium]
MIAVTDLSLTQGDFALRDVNLIVPDGEYGVLMGRSGCGKTTVLEVVCGLRPFTGGEIEVSGRSVGHLKPAERGIGYVPQDRALFPTMRVRDQIAFSLIVRSWTL